MTAQQIATKRCVHCGCVWRCWDDGTESLLDAEQKPGPCCDNAPSDPFIAWLARQPIGPPLTAKQKARVAEARSAIARGERGLSTEEVIAHARQRFKIREALRDRVLPNWGPGDPSDPLTEWRACVRVHVPDAADGDIDEEIEMAISAGLMWREGDVRGRVFQGAGGGHGA